ncbi:UPF0711 protein C18orf21 homolog isoform X3 [Paroedura picta]|uniref:UPF0711 protein C18orf21 homolog isoform X3 n=1 Tax=Paroedura picta TaxID=143630 RepID=UPI004055C057
MGRRRFLEEAARRMAGACPAQARMLLWTLSNTEGKNVNNEGQVCPFCFQLLLPDNHRLITCKMCKKTSRHYGKSRSWSMKTSAFETPTLLKKTTPFSDSHLGSQKKKLSLGSRTSTPGQSTSYFSSMSPRNAKSNFTRLKKLLSLEENKKNDKGDLKNFLSSL